MSSMYLLLDTQFCLRLAMVLGHFLWQGAVLALVAAVLAGVLRRASSRIRYGMFVAVLALMAVCPVATYVVAPVPETGQPVGQTQHAGLGIAPVPRPEQSVNLSSYAAELDAMSQAVVPDEDPDGSAGASPSPAVVTTQPHAGDGVVTRGAAISLRALLGRINLTPYAPWISWAYLLGVAMMLARLVLAVRGGRGLRKHAETIETPGILETLEQEAQALGMAVVPAIAYCERVVAPTIVGVVRPMILLPASLVTGLAPGQLDLLIRHELAHIRRYDHLVNILQSLIEAVLFFHPAVWYVSRKVRIEREHCCDDLVLAGGGEAMAYVKSLVQVAELSHAVHNPAAGLHATGKPSQLRARILRLLEGPKPHVRLTRLGALALTALVLIAATTVVHVAAVGDSEPVEAEKAADVAVEETVGTTSRHFFFMRRNRMNNRTTLVLAEARPDSLELKDIATGDLEGTALCAVRGKVYMVTAGDGLYSIDIETGQRQSVPDSGGYQAYCYDSERLYRIVGSGGLTLRLYDFAKGACRDIMELPGLPDLNRSRGRIAVAPDHKRLAYYGAKEPRFIGGFVLVIVDLDGGTCQEVGPTIEYLSTSSYDGEHPPFVWLDSDTVLVVRTSGLNAQNSLVDAAQAVAALNVSSGEMRDVVTLPGRFDLQVKLSPPSWDESAYAEAGGNRYRIDVQRGTLVEDDSVAGVFRIVRGEEGVEILHGGRRIDFAEDPQRLAPRYQHATNLLVSPDKQCVMWGVIEEEILRNTLKYYDSRVGKTHVVTETWAARSSWEDDFWVLWIDAKDLQTPSQEPPIPTGWTSLFAADDILPPKAQEEPEDPRKRMQDFVEFRMTSDKKRYRLHEPVELTLSVTNISDTDIEVLRPYPDDRIISARLDWTRGGRSRFFREIVTPEQTQERVLLKAGNTISETGTFEFSTPDSYQIKGRYGVYDHVLRGDIEASVAFVIESSPDDESLLEAKLERLVGQLREECKREMTSTRSSRGSSRQKTRPQIESIIETIRDIGPPARSFLIDAIRSENDERLVEKLYRPLTDMGSPSALPLYEERLAKGTLGEKIVICSGLRNLLDHEDSSEKARELLVSALGQQEPKVRLEAARLLRRHHDPLIKSAFEKALLDDFQEIRDVAAWYLVKAEDLELAQWLEQAAEMPTRARYMAARLIVPALEQHLHVKKGDLPADDWDTAVNRPPGIKQYQDTLGTWAEWARENPRFSSDFFSSK